jgi:hypothetical protein
MECLISSDILGYWIMCMIIPISLGSRSIVSFSFPRFTDSDYPFWCLQTLLVEHEICIFCFSSRFWRFFPSVNDGMFDQFWYLGILNNVYDNSDFTRLQEHSFLFISVTWWTLKMTKFIVTIHMRLFVVTITELI